MKNWMYSILCVLALGACDKSSSNVENAWGNEAELYAYNAKKISISTGMTGTLIQREGNCMPIVVEGGDCRWFPISRTVQVYEYTKQEGVHGNGPFYDSLSVAFVSEVEPDKDGFYQLELDPGMYSVFIIEGSKFYANSYDGKGGVNPIVISDDSTSEINMLLDYAVY